MSAVGINSMCKKMLYQRGREGEKVGLGDGGMNESAYAGIRHCRHSE